MLYTCNRKEDGVRIPAQRFGTLQADGSVRKEEIIIPDHPSKLKVRHADLDKVSVSYIKNAVAEAAAGQGIDAGAFKATEEDIEFLIAETRHDRAFVEKCLGELGVSLP